MINLLEKDFKTIIQVKKVILSILVFLLIWGSFSYFFKDYMSEQRLLDQVNIGIVDEEDSTLTRMLLGNFKNNDAFSGLFQLNIDTESRLLKAYDNNELSAIVYLPATFTDSLYRFENTPIYMTLNPNFPLKNTVLESIMGSYSNYIKAVDVGIYSLYRVLKEENVPRERLNEINNNVSLNMVLTALNRNDLFDYQPIDTFPSSQSISYFTYTIMILIMIFIATSATSAYHDEIHNGCMQRLVVSNVKIAYFILSKVLVLACYILILMLPFFIINQQINNLDLMAQITVLALYGFTIIAFISLSLTIGLLLHKQRISHMLSTLVTLILGLIGGQFLPIQIMPKVIQNLSSLTPNFWLLRYSLQINNNQTIEGLGFYLVAMFSFILINMLLQHVIIKRTQLWIK